MLSVSFFRRIAVALSISFVGLLGISGQDAQAATMTKTYRFELGDFVNPAGSTASPAASIRGLFTINVDPVGPYKDDSSVVTLDNFTAILADTGSVFVLPVGSILMLTQVQSGGHFDTFIDGVPIDNVIEPGTNNLVLGFDLSVPRFLACGADFACGPVGAIVGGYTLATLPGDVFIATSGSISAVPLPASLPLMAGALLLVAAVGFRQRKASALRHS